MFFILQVIATCLQAVYGTVYATVRAIVQVLALMNTVSDYEEEQAMARLRALQVDDEDLPLSDSTLRMQMAEERHRTRNYRQMHNSSTSAASRRARWDQWERPDASDQVHQPPPGQHESGQTTNTQPSVNQQLTDAQLEPLAQPEIQHPAPIVPCIRPRSDATVAEDPRPIAQLPGVAVSTPVFEDSDSDDCDPLHDDWELL
ncbi:uncharacterized protein B0I36DRAFT_369278 [Microdochium trichocladiopsis]|uniref:Uncharacterized protein n=1 Tax=Microdochium trichocladiopsis TaxID=1682393 RepID=A0A9P8XV06_9PEZI|nr:uncharacterized protein B0I36DRAFT_369278 [Microdochium trichocladiopsis]KAH7014307.1 hypothetical protein B0I36DRAFT_369278 [Microdochium trichocladiopsis]